MYAALASAKACVAIAAVAAVPSFGQPTVGGGGAVSDVPVHESDVAARFCVSTTDTRIMESGHQR